MGKVCGTGGDDDPGQVQRVDLHVLAGLRGLDDLAAAEVHHDVARVGRGAVGAGENSRSPGWICGQRNRRAVLAPLVGGAGDADPGGCVGGVDQAGAVVGVRAGGAPLVGLADLAQRERDRGRGGG